MARWGEGREEMRNDRWRTLRCAGGGLCGILAVIVSTLKIVIKGVLWPVTYFLEHTNSALCSMGRKAGRKTGHHCNHLMWLGPGCWEPARWEANPNMFGRKQNHTLLSDSSLEDRWCKGFGLVSLEKSNYHLFTDIVGFFLKEQNSVGVCNC